jgi:L-alanine-DL-glutamate epimerase-like enolase superfamily enzyme
LQSNPKIERIQVSVYAVPTETPESDGTFEWDKTSLVLVEVVAGGKTGLGYSYADTSTAQLIDRSLAPRLTGHDALAIGGAWRTMNRQIRNLGRPGIVSMAISALDNALWDLKGKLFDVSVAALLGVVRPAIMAYGSGGFTSYSESQLLTSRDFPARMQVRA